MLKRLLNTLILLLVCMCCTAAPKKKRNKYKQVTMEGYSIQRCHECDINPPKYQEISEIYHVDDILTELTFTVVGDCFLKDSLTFSISHDSLIFDFNFTDHSSVVDSIAEDYHWYTVKVILENFEIPNRFKIISNDLEIFISDEIYTDYISSSKQTDYGIIMEIDKDFG